MQTELFEGFARGEHKSGYRKGRRYNKALPSFCQTFDGFSGYGLDRQSNENTVQLYLQKFSDDHLMETILKRMTDDDLTEIFEITSKMMKKYLTGPEYHQLFLKEKEH